MSSSEGNLREQERVMFLFGGLFTLWALFSLGPIVDILAVLTAFALAMFRGPMLVTLSVAAGSRGLPGDVALLCFMMK